AQAESAGMGLDRFPFDSAALGLHQQQLVERIARRVAVSWSTSNPVRTIRVTGHTDSRGPADYNRALGLRRATAVQAGLTRAIERLRPGASKAIRFLTQSVGAKEPAVPSAGPQGTARNRRVAVVLNPLAASPSGLSESWENEALFETPGVSVAAPPLL